MSIVVGTLTIDLQANTASFSQSMDKMAHLSAKTSNDIKRSLEKITAAGIAMAAAIATGTAAAIKGALDAADELGKMAQAAGTTAETLSTLEYAAKLANVQNETLVKGLEKLSLAAFKAQGGNVQLERIFARVGVTVRDSNGALKDSGVLMEQLAVKFAKMGDSAGKTALAQAIFGKAGAQLIPFLNQYGSEQEKVNDEAHRFGLVLSTSTVEVAAHAHDSLEKLQSIMKGLGFSLLSATLPALDELLNKLIAISQSADLQGLARAFGGEVVKAVHALGDALDFAANHAKALKIALEAIAGLALARIAIPVIGDLAAGGIANVGKGLDRFTLGLLGLEKTLPVLTKFAGWLKYTASFVGLLAAEEGIASAASYVLGGAFAAVGGPIGIAVAAVAGLVIALYKFRDATFTLGNETYELRDIWNAAWIVMKETVSSVTEFFKQRMQDIKNAWSDVVNWIKSNPIGKFISDDLASANDRLGGYLSAFANRVVPGFVRNAIDEAKRRRLAAEGKAGTSSPTTSDRATPKLPPPDTSGLGKPRKDHYGDEIDKLDLAIEAQQKYLSVIDGTPEVIQAANAAEKAHAIIVELNNKLHDEGRAKLTALQRATIEQKVATEESLKALVDYGREIVSQQHSTDLSIQQARAMAIAQTQGDEAVRRAAVDNAILALSYNKTAEQLARMAPELIKLRGLLTSKGNADLLESTNRDIFALRQESGAQDILRNAIMGTIEAQRRAEIQARTYALSQQIATASDDAARMALLEKRDAIEQEMRAQQQAADLAEARRTLGGPADQFEQEKDHLRDLVYALAQAQKGYLTYAQESQAAAAYQDIFDKAIDQTVQSMVRFGDARDGVDAFFLDMQKQAQSTASIIYEAMHSAFDKISDNLAELVTGGKTSFAKMFQDIGKQIVQSEIKKQLQEGIGKLAGKLGIDLNGILGKTSKIDGSTKESALWVRSADGFGQPRSTNELTGLIGPNPSQPPDQTSSTLPSLLASLFGKHQKSPFGESLGLPKGNELTDLLGSVTASAGGFGGDESAMDFATDEGVGSEGGGGILSTITSVLGGLKNGMQSQGTPKGTASNPLYVKMISAAAAATGAAGGLDVLSDIFGGGAKGTQSNPVYVKNAGGEGSGLGDILGGFGGSDSSGDNSGGSDSSGGSGFWSSLGSIFSSIFGGKSSGGDSGDSGGGLIPHAEGGPVSPSSAYLVGEKGPEILTGTSGNITSNANSMRALSSGTGSSHYYSIDARGTDPAQTEQRVRRAILESHNSAITTSVQASAERMKRVPHRY